MERVSKSTSKRMMARLVFFVVVLPLLIAGGWFAAPYVSSRLPEFPIAHMVVARIAKVRSRMSNQKDKVEMAIKEEMLQVEEKVKASARAIKKEILVDEEASKEETGTNGVYLLEEGKKLISSCYDQLGSFFR